MKFLLLLWNLLVSCLGILPSLAFQPILPKTSRRRLTVHPTRLVPSSAGDILLCKNRDSRCWSATSSDPQSPQIDVDALLKYGTAAIVQMAGFALVLSAFDQGVEATGIHPPLWLSGLFFYGCSLKSRILNPLSNERPKVGSPVASEIIRPNWFPPGVIFPIMWILIIGPVRAYTSALVYDSTGEFLNMATLSFLFHLTVGDVWNTINNVEKRLGAAASGVVFVILSAANASYQYYQIDETAGGLLVLTLAWLCTAGALVTSIWKLNPDERTGLKDALYPVKGDIETQFAWFSDKE